MTALAVGLGLTAAPLQPAAEPDRGRILDTMKRATAFMVDRVSTNGGYVWSYLPDLSRRWGELEARESMIWIQAPGTATMGHLLLDAYHATSDEYYYRAAEGVGAALVRGQHRSGGWNYVVDFAGEASLRGWYDTVGQNAWRLEEFQHYQDNATFDDGVTAEAATFLLRLYAEKRDGRYRPPLDRAIQFVLDSQHPVGAWPQRYPPATTGAGPGAPGYASYLTFNDDVTGRSIDLLILCYQALGEARLLDPIRRGMHAFLSTQQPPPQPGWALQYTLDLKPAAARTYEPLALATHTTATSLERLVRFYRLTGERKFLERIPESLAWLDGLTLPAGVAPADRTHPTFVALGSNAPLYVHRTGSNVVNGRYYTDANPANTLAHYSAFRRIDVAGLRRLYEDAKAVPPAEVVKGSPLVPGASIPFPRYFSVPGETRLSLASVVGGLNAECYWPARLGRTSHAYRGPGSKTIAPGDFARTHVGDESDTSPYPDDSIVGISTAAYVRNMSVLIHALPAR